ncbi:MAG: NYN domain-containing protein [Chloroflexi bacterium]|nr:NYN domain-containing protein [Chloroflexota bacterium]
MIYLIDGHNLIGKMPDIKLADPNDEEKLVRRLHNWAAGDKRRQIELFFDSGDFGGWHTPITAPNIRVYYARQGQKADDLLIRALRVLKNRQAYTLITSDNEILAAARKRRVGYVLSEEFAALMAAEAAERLAPPPDPGATADPGTPPTRNSPRRCGRMVGLLWRCARKRAAAVTRLPAVPPSPPTPKQRKEEPAINQEELSEWLAVFGDVPETGLENHPAPIPTLAADPKPKPGQPPKPKTPPAKQKFSTDKLSNDEINDWLDVFGKRDGDGR